MTIKYRTESLSPDEVAVAMLRGGMVCENVLVDLNDVIERDMEGFNDLLETKLLSHMAPYVLTDIAYKVVGAVNGAIVIEVCGCLECTDDEPDEDNNEEG